MGKFNQTIDIPSGSNKRKLYAGSPVQRRWDCGCTAKLEVTIDQEDKSSRSQIIEVVPVSDDSDREKSKCPW